ncbi:unnamed protein product [Arctia plantaginis]|uniref:LITAF domain-containing protein n=1 Tax=Arctia plantaginis TaxID=874455 RepID=A0A8S1B8P1_ARCPL|nr:unnamed protein product [Arctia plantaginis]CAB3258138.1 unnamed protein product [Arctia plantaginis]
MEHKDTRIGPRPDNPPPYSVEPPSQTSYPAETPGQTAFVAQPPGQTSFSAVPPGSYQYATVVPPGSVPFTAAPQQGQPHVYIATQPRAGAVVHTVIVQQMSPVPTSMVCKSCNVQIVTRVEMNPTIRTHLFAMMLCLIGCWPLACVPYCIDSCYNSDHYCPNCNAYIGSYIN